MARLRDAMINRAKPEVSLIRLVEKSGFMDQRPEDWLKEIKDSLGRDAL
ncbi:MAG TPA: hypothetical protein GX696_02785 [Pseudomonadaceae bacterium]|nr:hypothetical protein [Pseudomonadaceae bacterium]